MSDIYTDTDEIETDDPATTQTPTDPAARERHFAALERQRQKAEREAAELKVALAERDRRDALRDALEELKIDAKSGVGKLFADQYAAGKGEPTADAVRAAVLADAKLAEVLGVGRDPRDVAAEVQAQNAQALAGAEAPPGGGEIDAKTVQSWDREARLQFMRSHPAEWDKILAGQKVPASLT